MMLSSWEGNGLTESDGCVLTAYIAESTLTQCSYILLADCS